MPVMLTADRGYSMYCCGEDFGITSSEMQNGRYGCNEFLKFTARRDHETELCLHRPFRCPGPNCNYEGPKQTLPLHLESVHQVQTVQLESSRNMQFTMKVTDPLMLLRIGAELVVIHHEAMESLGDVFFCSSFGGIPEKLFYLKIEVKNDAKYYIMRTGVPDIGRQEEWRSDFLLVPCANVKSRAVRCQFDLCFNEAPQV